jgi:hypothetical protein
MELISMINRQCGFGLNTVAALGTVHHYTERQNLNCVVAQWRQTPVLALVVPDRGPLILWTPEVGSTVCE